MKKSYFAVLCSPLQSFAVLCSPLQSFAVLCSPYFRLFLLLIFLPLGVLAQQSEVDKQIAQKLSTLDLSDLKTNFLLNKGVFTTSEIAEFRKKPRNKYGQIVMHSTAEDWQNLYERLIGADLRTNGRTPDFQQFAEKDRLKQTKNNVIPIGIINADVTLMDSVQLALNAKQKGNKQQVSADKYEKLYMVLASVLQEDIYQADVKFRLSQALHLGTSKSEIKMISIDFQDGKGFRDYKGKEQTLSTSDISGFNSTTKIYWSKVLSLRCTHKTIY